MTKVARCILAGVLVGTAFLGFGTCFTTAGVHLMSGKYSTWLDARTSLSIFLPGLIVGGLFFGSLDVLLHYSRARFTVLALSAGLLGGWMYVTVLWTSHGYMTKPYLAFAPFRVASGFVSVLTTRPFATFLKSNYGVGFLAGLLAGLIAFLSYPALRASFVRFGLLAPLSPVLEKLPTRVYGPRKL